MRCTPVEKLLPLYVEGDLGALEVSEVSAHLSSCEGCRQLAEELRASQERLHNFAAPEFDEEFYRSIRGAVLTEISSRPRAQSTFLNIFRAPFMRPALAASLLLLITLGGISALLYSRFSGGASARARLTAIEKSLREINPAEYSESSPRRAETVALTGRPVMERAGGQSEAALFNVARSGIQARRRAEGAVPERAIPQGNDGAPVAQAPASPVRKEKRDEASNVQAVARMEIKTGDPNIRIIWLARKSSE